MNEFLNHQPTAELVTEQRASRARRRQFTASPLGQFARGMMAAMAEYFKFRGAGVSREDAVKGIEAVLRETWPLPLSKFAPHCDNCEDTGFSLRLCWDQERCGRRFCVNRPDYEHRYVEPCFCPAGERHKARQATSDDAIARVGKTKKSRGFTKLGDAR